jgi:Xaa-Pro aminopeptidase
VHDCAAVGPHAPLEPGAVLAIEPGLYIPPDPSRYGALAGIGVRIEDDVEVVEGGARVLSAGLPVEPGEVEELVGSLLDGGGSGSGSSSSISARR